MSANLVESGGQMYHFTIADDRPSIAVVEAMAYVTNRDALDIDPLVGVIDPEAIDRLVSDTDDVSISFRWEGYRVELSASGDLLISE